MKRIYSKTTEKINGEIVRHNVFTFFNDKDYIPIKNEEISIILIYNLLYRLEIEKLTKINCSMENNSIDIWVCNETETFYPLPIKSPGVPINATRELLEFNNRFETSGDLNFSPLTTKLIIHIKDSTRMGEFLEDLSKKRDIKKINPYYFFNDACKAINRLLIACKSIDKHIFSGHFGYFPLQSRLEKLNFWNFENGYLMGENIFFTSENMIFSEGLIKEIMNYSSTLRIKIKSWIPFGEKASEIDVNNIQKLLDTYLDRCLFYELLFNACLRNRDDLKGALIQATISFENAISLCTELHLKKKYIKVIETLKDDSEKKLYLKKGNYQKKFYNLHDNFTRELGISKLIEILPFLIFDGNKRNIILKPSEIEIAKACIELRNKLIHHKRTKDLKYWWSEWNEFALREKVVELINLVRKIEPIIRKEIDEEENILEKLNNK